MPKLRLAALTFGLALVLSGCGVRFNDPQPGTEFFASIAVTGDMRAGQPLLVTAAYTQTYPVDLEVACELRQQSRTLKEIGRTGIPLLEGGHPDATPRAGDIRFEFTVDEPGRYTVECLTPKDEDNYITEKITVGA